MVVNSSLREEQFPAPFKEAQLHPLLKKPSLYSAILDNFHSASHLLFLGKGAVLPLQRMRWIICILSSQVSGPDMGEKQHRSNLWMASGGSGKKVTYASWSFFLACQQP